MTVYFRKERECWMFKFTDKRVQRQPFKEIARNEDGTKCETRRDAEAAERRKRSEVEQRAKSKQIPRPAESDYTLAQALNALKPSWKRQSDWKNKRRAIDELIEFFEGEKGITRIADIGEVEIQEYVDWALARPVQLWKGGVRDANDEANARFWITRNETRDPRTVNDTYLNVLRLALKHTAKLRDPVTKKFVFRDLPKVQRLKTETHDADPIPDAIVDEILPSFPQHLQEAILLTAFFGFRRTEAFKLTVQQVDFQDGGIRLKARGVKEKRDAFLAGSTKAMAFLRQLVDQARARGVEYLITWPGPGKVAKYRPIKSGYHTWRRRMVEIVKEKYGRTWRWHDMRAALITYVAIQRGPMAAQTVARHVSFQTTQRYIAVADSVRREAAESIADRPIVTAALRQLGGKGGEIGPQSGPQKWSPAKIVTLKKASN